MFRTSAILFLFVGCLLLGSESICAFEKKLARAELAASELVERYSGRSGADVSSGSTLVSVVLGNGPVVSGMADVLLPLSKDHAGDLICVRVTTRDGLFWSDNPFIVPLSEYDHVVAGPVAKRHLKELRKYNEQDVMVRVVVPDTDNCSAYKQESIIIPAIGNQDGTLRAYLLTKGKAASVRLKPVGAGNEYISAVRCESFLSGSTIASDRVCTLQIPMDAPTGNYKLHVRVKGRFEKEDLYYTIQLPAKSQ